MIATILLILLDSLSLALQAQNSDKYNALNLLVDISTKL